MNVEQGKVGIRLSGKKGLTVDAVDHALAETLYPPVADGRPAYALPDGHVMHGIASRLSVPERDAERLLCRTAAIQIGLHKPDPLFLTIAGRAGKSRGLDVPPGLTTLTVLTLAADRMHAAGDMAASNFYGRLHELLDTPQDRKDAVERSHRDHVQILWDRLNAWLENWEGVRGVPTAYAVGQWRFVGLPLSQALLRRRDRERLPTVFVEEGLPPGYRMSPADMEAALDAWMNRSAPFFSHTLRTLWSDSTARDRITAVACLELQSWDGQGAIERAQGNSSKERAIRLLVSLRSFPRTRLALDLSIPTLGSDCGNIVVNGTDGDTVVPLRDALVGTARLEDPQSVDFESLLTDELEGHDHRGAQYRRRPRRVVPLRFDELQQAWIEQESAQLAETTLVLAADSLDVRIRDLLAKVARPGWEQLPRETSGLPQGWSAFRDVQILDRAGGAMHLDLQPLLPRSTVALVFSGGLALPGLLRKWSSLAPPEIHASSAGAESITVEIHRGSRVGELIRSKTTGGGVVLLSLEDADNNKLGDGEYLVTVHADGAKKPAAAGLVRLRSSETPEMRRRESRLVHGPSSGLLWPLSAGAEIDQPAVDGARVTVPAQCVAAVGPMPLAVERPGIERKEFRTRPVKIGRGLGGDSCMRTGMHRIHIPDDRGGRPFSRTVEGVCTTCGLVKRYPTTAAGAAARKRARAKKVWVPPNLSDVPPVQAQGDLAWATIFDALCHLGSGSLSALARLVSQLDNSSLGLDVLSRNLESMGHIDMVRDPRTLEVVEWEVTPATLTAVSDGTWLLVGRRTPRQLRQLSVWAPSVDGRVSEELDSQVPRVAVRLDEQPLRELAELLNSEWPDLEVQADTARRLAQALPVLSSLIPGLTRISVPATSSVEVWNTTSASWSTATSIEQVGAFRITHHSRTYVVRDLTDLTEGTMSLANAQLSKHLAHLWAGDPLARYDEGSGSVTVPLGADLPGMYSRALVLASGRLPVPRRGTGLLQYPEVPRGIADTIHARLTQ